MRAIFPHKSPSGAPEGLCAIAPRGLSAADSSRRTESFAACAVAFAAFCLYLFCLAPSVATGGDCGELISASYRLGVAHPSGYALYCLVGKIFATLLPFGEVAWRYNLFSALCGAATCGVVTLLAARLSSKLIAPDLALPHKLWSACCTGLLLAGLTFFGSQALIAEVYAPTGLLVSLIFLCVAHWESAPQLRSLGALALLLGLSLNLHLSVVFLWPGLIVFFFIKWRERSADCGARRHPALQAAIFGVCFAIGLSVTLYLPWRAATFPEPISTRLGGQEYTWGQTLDWGHPVDFPRWKAHVLVQQYKSLLWKPTKVSILGHELQGRTFTKTPQASLQLLLQLAAYLALQLLACAPLVLIGAFQSWRKSNSTGRAFAAFLALTFFINVFIAIQYDVDTVFDIVNFLFPAYVVLAIWLGLGIAWLLRTLANWGEKLDHKKSSDSSQWQWRFLTTARLLLIGTLITQWIFFVQAASWRGNTRVRDATILRAAAAEKLQQQTGRPPALLLFSDDTLFPFWYAQKVLNRAEQARTMWGPAMHAYEDQKKVPQLAAELLKAGPVATTQWQPELDMKFPYAPLTANGNLWQLTTAALPPPAQPTKERVVSKSSVLRAKFLQKEIKRFELVGFQMDFPMPVVQQGPPKRASARQVGTAEILIAPRALSLRPEPTQTEVYSGKKPLVWKQSRRLIVPAGAKAGQILRTVLPLQFSIELQSGDYEAWARVVPSQNKSEIAWKKVDSLRLVVR